MKQRRSDTLVSEAIIEVEFAQSKWDQINQLLNIFYGPSGKYIYLYENQVLSDDIKQFRIEILKIRQRNICQHYHFQLKFQSLISAYENLHDSKYCIIELDIILSKLKTLQANINEQISLTIENASKIKLLLFEHFQMFRKQHSESMKKFVDSMKLDALKFV
ncbi:Hypothetical_protein [Hexamita inflata]|uniref:Hypothetical_protein n=1 Tax=Hexamita inflata TaxID=28002 RepID=A0AA86R622_9EUKA|nr:Hypothetical protein HINF_LOCUS54548 [Hexamita inflata]